LEQNRYAGAFGSFWNKNTLALQACQKPIIEDYLDFLH